MKLRKFFIRLLNGLTFTSNCCLTTRIRIHITVEDSSTAEEVVNQIKTHSGVAKIKVK